MAKYRIGKNNYEVDLTKKKCQLGFSCHDNCEVMFEKHVKFI